MDYADSEFGLSLMPGVRISKTLCLSRLSGITTVKISRKNDSYSGSTRANLGHSGQLQTNQVLGLISEVTQEEEATGTRPGLMGKDENTKLLKFCLALIQDKKLIQNKIKFH